MHIVSQEQACTRGRIYDFCCSSHRILPLCLGHCLCPPSFGLFFFLLIDDWKTRPEKNDNKYLSELYLYQSAVVPIQPAYTWGLGSE